jgi:catechol 2,3-dioxygenase-like lactoylglutathione lyase family enzyme
MIDHVSVRVSNLKNSKRFYEEALKPLGYKVVFGEEKVFWAFDVGNGALLEIVQSERQGTLVPVHVALRVKNKKEVDAFYKSAMKAGGKDNGAPGLCPEYASNYYASFVPDPDGHNIEAMVDAP